MKYELTLLTNNDVSPKVIRRKMEELLPHIEEMSYDGYKRLAYPVNGYDMAHYYWYKIEIEEPITSEIIANELNRTEWAIRYLLVSVDGRKNNGS